MSKGLKVTFLIHAVVATLFGAAILLVPRPLAELVQWRPFDPTMSRMVGASLLALAGGSWLGFATAGWEQLRIILYVEIAFTVLGALAGVYELVIGDAPFAAVAPTGLLGAFAVVWVFFVIRTKE